MGRNGAVASNHPLATQAGLDVLRQGGNAVDATVAVGLTVGVVEPHMSGIGGDSFYQLHIAGHSRGVVVNATGAAPAGTDLEAVARNGVANFGPRSISTPGTVAGLAALHARYGRLPWAALFEAAIEHAREGFGVTHSYRHFARQERRRLVADPRSREVFLLGDRDGEPPQLSALIRQPELADTLAELAQSGPDAFYRGRLAGRMARAVQEGDGWLSEADLDGCEPVFEEPIGIRYRGFEVRQTGPNSTGFVLLQQLKIAERFELGALEPGSADLVHVLVEAKKLAFADRERFGGDPRFVEIPLERLLSDGYADECASRIDMARAWHPEDIAPAGSSDTTYFCVVDREGNAVSAIQSLNLAFGSGVLAGDTGVLMNNRMAYWHLEEGHANRLAPGKRVRHTMNAPMIFRDGQPWCVFGTPGADNQVQVNFQVAVAMIDSGFDPQQAVEAPRWSSDGPGQDSNYPHPGSTTLSLESRFADGVFDELAARGHVVRRLGPLDGPCNVEVIRLADNGLRVAGSDPRRDGWALAY